MLVLDSSLREPVLTFPSVAVDQAQPVFSSLLLPSSRLRSPGAEKLEKKLIARARSGEANPCDQVFSEAVRVWISTLRLKADDLARAKGKTGEALFLVALGRLRVEDRVSAGGDLWGSMGGTTLAGS